MDPELLDDLVAANRILAEHNVIDAYGHVSIRHPENRQRFLLARAKCRSCTTIRPRSFRSA